MAASIKTGMKILSHPTVQLHFSRLKQALKPPTCIFPPSWRNPDWEESILPERGCIGSRAVTHEGSALVSSQVLAVGALDGDASVFHKLKEKVLRLLSVGAHEATAGHVPELSIRACRRTSLG